MMPFNENLRIAFLNSRFDRAEKFSERYENMEKHYLNFALRSYALVQSELMMSLSSSPVTDGIRIDSNLINAREELGDLDYFASRISPRIKFAMIRNLTPLVNECLQRYPSGIDGFELFSQQNEFAGVLA